MIILGGVVVISAVLALFLWQVPASNARIYKSGELFTAEVNLLTVAEPYMIIIDGGIDAGNKYSILPYARPAIIYR